MRPAVRLACCFFAITFIPAVAAHAEITKGANSDSGGQAATPPAKSQNPLEIKAPGPGEEKAYKAFQHFQSMPETDAAKKAQSGEDFLNKFPTSGYAMYVDQYLAVAYIQSGQVDKGLTTGEKAIQLNPQDFRTMAVMGQTIARTLNDATPDAAGKLEKAEGYAKNAVAGVATWVKPDSMPDANFTALKNEVLTMGHATLGLVALHKKNFEEAIPELQQAVDLGANSDPTNFYLLGVANENSAHYDKAAAAFEKCAAVKGTNLTGTCASLQDQAKKNAEQAKPKS